MIRKAEKISGARLEKLAVVDPNDFLPFAQIKRVTLRPKDQMDALALREQYGLEESD